MNYRRLNPGAVDLPADWNSLAFPAFLFSSTPEGLSSPKRLPVSHSFAVVYMSTALRSKTSFLPSTALAANMPEVAVGTTPAVVMSWPER